jgi:hypothetical protein
MLMPDRKFDADKVPVAKKDETKRLPDDDTCFEFVEPGGDERLLIFASPEPVPGLTAEIAFKDSKTPQATIQLKSVTDNVKKDFTTRSAAEWLSQEIEDESGAVSQVFGSSDEKVAPKFFHEIVLKCKPKGGAKP